MARTSWLQHVTPVRIAYFGVLALALAMPLMNNKDTFESFELPKQVTLHIGVHVTLTLMLAAALLHLLVMPVQVAGETARTRLRAATRWPPLIVAGLVVLAWTISTIFSIAPVVSFWGTWPRWAGWWQQLHVVILFVLAASALTSLRRVQWLTGMVLAGAFISSAFALLQHFGHKIYEFLPFPFFRFLAAYDVLRPHSTFGNPNFVSDYIAMSLPITLATAYAARQRWLRALCTVIALVQGGAVVVTQTRGVWVGLSMGLPLLVILLVRHRRGPWLKVALGIGAAGLLVIAGLYTFRAQLRDVRGFGRVVSIFEAQDKSAGSRLAVWNTARQMWLDRPLTGYGPDTFGSASFRRLPPQNDAILSESSQELFDRAHNTTLDGLAAVGALGMLSLASVAALAIWCGYRILRVTDFPPPAGEDGAPPDPFTALALARHPLSTGLVAGMAAYLVAQQFSIESAGASSLAWTLAGVIIGSGLHLSRLGAMTLPGNANGASASGTPEARNRPPARTAAAVPAPPVWAVAGAGVLIVLAASLSGWWERRQITASVEFKRANGLARAERSAEAAATYEESIKEWPFERRTWLELGFSRRHNGRVMTDKTVARKWLLDSVTAVDKSIEIDPQNPLYLSKSADVLGEVAASLGDQALSDRALKMHEQAIAISPDRWVLWGDAGLTYLRLGKAQQGREALARTVMLYDRDWVQFARYGDALAAVGDRSAARRAYNQALSLLAQQKQDHQGVRESLARLGPD